ncbi:hypothetical protein [Curtobacterium flaccumfaciens]|uniref:phosphoribosyltransferase-like protein n=1 Tax=Curtobacterium flaccumfaciens TaxID=2035 RepID=UPI00265B4D28|nr:hypothetical protein [Curtobacterium flaccumfaciens]MCS5506764.1 hypothetical protein [Curtobacterium flaccumfaciens pv. flaccumfaciens]
MVDIANLNPSVKPLVDQIQRLSSEAWDSHVNGTDISRWLDNFTGKVDDLAVEHANALHLLAEFNYFGGMEIRELLRCVYRDLYRYPIVQSVRNAQSVRPSAQVMRARIKAELSATRFLGIGSPAESGTHLLYLFRQVNHLPPSLFISEADILDGPSYKESTKFRDVNVRRLVYIDDLLGSGEQVKTYSKEFLADVRRIALKTNQPLSMSYYTLFAKPDGLKVARSLSFTDVAAVHELDSSSEAFSSDSRAYVGDLVDGVSKSAGERIAFGYGEQVFRQGPLGWNDDQLLIGLNHNVPDNTLPIFWAGQDSGAEWAPIFPRYGKV